LMEQQRVAREASIDPVSTRGMTNMLLGHSYKKNNDHGRPYGQGQPPNGFKSQC